MVCRPKTAADIYSFLFIGFSYPARAFNGGNAPIANLPCHGDGDRRKRYPPSGRDNPSRQRGFGH